MTPPLWETLRRAWLGGELSPTSERAVEFAVMALAVGIRISLFIQALISVPTALASFPHVGRYLLTCAIAVGWSAFVVRQWMAHRALRSSRLAAADAAMACAVIVAQGWAWPPDLIFVGWLGWGQVLALHVTSSCAASTMPRRQLVAWTCVIGATYAAVSLLVGTTGPVRTLSDLAAILCYPVVVRIGVSTLRALAHDADRARCAAAQVAQDAERQRNQLLLHDTATLLRMMAEEHPEQLREALREQARRESSRIRSFLKDPRDNRPMADSALVSAVREVAAEFPDLPIELSTDLADEVRLAGQHGAALRLALSALLVNVRVHARATQVVIHADCNSEEREWEVVVRDDGVGFDQGAAAEGFGLKVQVREVLREQGIQLVLRSEPGDGTAAVIRGRSQ